MPGIVVEVQNQAVLARLNKMVELIDHAKKVETGNALSTWQTEDLHRQKPFTMRFRAKGLAVTVVRPHSLYEMVRSEGAALDPKSRRRLVRGLRSKLGHPLGRKFLPSLRVHRHWSTRPILRSELFKKLAERATEVIAKEVSWKNTRAAGEAGRVRDRIEHELKRLLKLAATRAL
jgi:hypothetical protein